MKNLGNFSYKLGIHVHRDSHGLHLNQKEKYILDLLDKTDMLGAKAAKPYAAPCVFGKKFNSDTLPDPTSYRQLIGALQYCPLTRPNISYFVNESCQLLACPTTTHFTAAKRICRYLKGTTNYGLYFIHGPLQLNAYCDSDFGDTIDRRSTRGYTVFLGHSLISCQAKKQPVVSRSSTEAEYCTMAIATTELYWFRRSFKELKVR